MKIKPDAILFDLDGVLVDSVDAWLTSLNIALTQFNHKMITRDDFIDNYWGHDLHNTLNLIGVDQRAVVICNSLYKKNLNKVNLYPNVKLTLQKLNSYKKGLITNTPKDQTNIILKKFDLNKYFDVVITSDDVSYAKPDPEIVLKACKILHVEPKRVIIIGDTKSDIEAGKAAGCKIIGMNIKTDYNIRKISELTKIIKQI
jgi:HAD superfamily hydrolase (TIGR01549 family)